MSEPVYTSSNGTTVTDVTDQWESSGEVSCIMHIKRGRHNAFVASGINSRGNDVFFQSCFVAYTGNLCDDEGNTIATPKPKPKKYRPFADGDEFWRVTEGRPVWVRYGDSKLKQLVTKVDEDEILTANWTWKFSGEDCWSQQMSFTPHIADSWVPFGVEVQQESGGAK